jgi:dUTP pyrophosphatase
MASTQPMTSTARPEMESDPGPNSATDGNNYVLDDDGITYRPETPPTAGMPAINIEDYANSSGDDNTARSAEDQSDEEGVLNLDELSSEFVGLQPFPDDIQQSIDELIDGQSNIDINRTSVKMEVVFSRPEVRALYEASGAQFASDSGWDLRCTEDTVLVPGKTHFLDFEVAVCAQVDARPTALWLVPRSSISKTPLRMANSPGLIDAEYRGTIRAAVDHTGTEPYAIKKGDRLFQLAAPSLEPIQWSEVEAHHETDRGEGAFGSTGR